MSFCKNLRNLTIIIDRCQQRASNSLPPTGVYQNSCVLSFVQPFSQHLLPRVTWMTKGWSSHRIRSRSTQWDGNPVRLRRLLKSPGEKNVRQVPSVCSVISIRHVSSALRMSSYSTSVFATIAVERDETSNSYETHSNQNRARF